MTVRSVFLCHALRKTEGASCALSSDLDGHDRNIVSCTTISCLWKYVKELFLHAGQQNRLSQEGRKEQRPSEVKPEPDGSEWLDDRLFLVCGCKGTTNIQTHQTFLQLFTKKICFLAQIIMKVFPYYYIPYI